IALIRVGVGGQFVWSTGNEVNIVNWRKGEPNNLNDESVCGQWIDERCNMNNGYKMCQSELSDLPEKIDVLQSNITDLAKQINSLFSSSESNKENVQTLKSVEKSVATKIDIIKNETNEMNKFMKKQLRNSEISFMNLTNKLNDVENLVVFVKNQSKSDKTLLQLLKQSVAKINSDFNVTDLPSKIEALISADESTKATVEDLKSQMTTVFDACEAKFQSANSSLIIQITNIFDKLTSVKMDFETEIEFIKNNTNIMNDLMTQQSNYSETNFMYLSQKLRDVENSVVLLKFDRSHRKMICFNH
ncbi:hypothetical protein B4U80_14270, partial [Leptotrombidium deliense]